MYADRVEAAGKRSVKERLNGNVGDDSIRRSQVTGKRQRQHDKWEHDLYEDGELQIAKCMVDSQDLRLKLQRKSGQQGSQIVKGPVSGARDLREKLSGTMNVQPINADPPKAKLVAARPTRRSIAVKAPELESKKAANVTPRKKSQQKADTSVDSFLQSLGLEKYLINFQVEEVDMTTLIHMTDEELKTIGIPMGPRKKILLALESKGADIQD